MIFKDRITFLLENYIMVDKKFIFLAGLHRSGTSLLHEIIRDHPSVSGFTNTGAPEDEGQHLQNVFEPASTYGGPGKFIFDNRSYMNELHSLASNESAIKIFDQWSQYYDISCEYLIEKSPPNLIRLRFLQKLYPSSKFIVILRHPLAVGYATQKWSKTSIKSLVLHSLMGYERFLKDLPFLNSVYVIRYEDFVAEPQSTINDIYNFIGLDPTSITHKISNDINDKYIAKWSKNRESIVNKLLFKVTPELECRANKFGYSLKEYKELLPASILGTHNK